MATVGSRTSYMSGLVLGWSLGQNPSVVAPISTTLALYTAMASNLGTDGTEVVGGTYVRQAIVWGPPSTVSGITSIANTNRITFPTATANWGVIVGAIVFNIDSIGVSRASYFGDIYPVATINTGSAYQILPGDLVISDD